MRPFLNELGFEEACDQIETLDIWHNTVARQLFFQTAIDFSRQELRRKGKELFSVASVGEILEFCKLWFERQSTMANDMAFIVLIHAIQSTAFEIANDKKQPETTIVPNRTSVP
jgi:hypothetical protein